MQKSDEPNVPILCKKCNVVLKHRNDRIKLENCFHIFCKNCVSKSITSQVDLGIILCPDNPKCSMQITSKEIKRYAPKHIYNQIETDMRKNLVQVKCPHCKVSI